MIQLRKKLSLKLSTNINIIDLDYYLFNYIRELSKNSKDKIKNFHYCDTTNY